MLVFIPNSVKISHTVLKDFRPSCLSPFLLKAYFYTRMILNPKLLPARQHAFNMERLSKIALPVIVGAIENSFSVRMGFLDIMRAFNNMQLDSIIAAL